MIELKYKIPKINGRDLSYNEVAYLLGYTDQVESETKKQSFKDEKELMEIVDNSLSARVDRENNVVYYTEFIPNPVTPEQFVQGAFEKVVKEKIFELLQKNGAKQVAEKIISE